MIFLEMIELGLIESRQVAALGLKLNERLPHYVLFSSVGEHEWCNVDLELQGKARWWGINDQEWRSGGAYLVEVGEDVYDD
jgi:hypothetical protein